MRKYLQETRRLLESHDRALERSVSCSFLPYHINCIVEAFIFCHAEPNDNSISPPAGPGEHTWWES